MAFRAGGSAEVARGSCERGGRLGQLGQLARSRPSALALFLLVAAPAEAYGWWGTIDGPCTGSDGCVRSPNFPSSYSAASKCTISVDSQTAIHATSFITESVWDVLSVNGNSYSGSVGPGVTVATRDIVWTADGFFSEGGWELCAVEAAPCSVSDGSGLSSSYPCACGSATCVGAESCDAGTGTCSLVCSAANPPPDADSRLVSNPGISGDWICDDSIVPGWYRWSGHRIPTEAPGTRRCGSMATGWINQDMGALPTSAGQQVTVTVCFEWVDECKEDSRRSISVENCGDGSYAYYLVPLPENCNRYCFEPEPESVVGFDLVGDGWCRPSGCIVTASTCRTNGFYKDASDASECAATCNSTATCVAYAISASTYEAAPNRCFIYSSGTYVPEGWVQYRQTNYDVAATSGDNGVLCYRVQATANPASSPAPAPAPTTRPTGTLTASPIAAPTPVPSAAPTGTPTPVPTASPTASPTAAPTLGTTATTTGIAFTMIITTQGGGGSGLDVEWAWSSEDELRQALATTVDVQKEQVHILNVWITTDSLPQRRLAQAPGDLAIDVLIDTHAGPYDEGELLSTIEAMCNSPNASSSTAPLFLTTLVELLGEGVPSELATASVVASMPPEASTPAPTAGPTSAPTPTPTTAASTAPTPPPKGIEAQACQGECESGAGWAAPTPAPSSSAASVAPVSDAALLAMVVVPACIVLCGCAVVVVCLLRMRRKSHPSGLGQSDPETPAAVLDVSEGEDLDKGMFFWFMSRDNFLNLPDDQPIPRNQTLRARGKLTRIYISVRDVLSGEAAKDKAAISHRWFQMSHIDQGGAKLRRIKQILLEHHEIKYIWLDWVCIPQWWGDAGEEGGRTDAEEAEFTKALQNILPYLYLGCKVFILWDADYNRRFWPCVEAWTSMRQVTSGGIGPADPAQLRAHIYGMGGSEGEEGAARDFMVASWLHKAPAEAVSKLRNSEYYVTNQKDKEVNLAVIEGLDTRMKQIITADVTLLQSLQAFTTGDDHLTEPSE